MTEPATPAPTWRATPSKPIWRALAGLDRLLAHAVEQARHCYGDGATADAYRGLYVDDREASRLVARGPGESALDCDGVLETGVLGPLADEPPFATLAADFRLDAFDLDALVVALAPELDLRYERLYVFLQDDVTRRRPTLELVLDLLCRDRDERLARRRHFAADAPLLRAGLVRLLPDDRQTRSSWLAHQLLPDPYSVHVVLGERGLDDRLAAWCSLEEQFVAASPGVGSDAWARPLLDLLDRAPSPDAACRLYLHGPPGTGKRSLARVLAAHAGTSLLVGDLHALRVGDDSAAAVRLACRESRRLGCSLLLAGADALAADPRAWPALLAEVAVAPGLTVLTGASPWPGSGGQAPGVLPVAVPLPDTSMRREIWRRRLDAGGWSVAGPDVDAVAARFRLTPAQITDAVDSIGLRARESPGPPASGTPDRASLFAAARGQSPSALARLARRVPAERRWSDLVLPDDVVAQLRELCLRVALRSRVLDEWGFGPLLSGGTGTTALFAGPSGTGKTMAAQVIAAEVGVELYAIDLSGVVSKYIGETEKNLDRIFGAAEDANAVLFFDEADALFGKRSEVRDSHDRYANVEVSYLLQKLEEYDGTAILASNLPQNLDAAFVRRLAFSVPFPFPDEPARRAIWAGIWPAATPLAPDVDLDRLAAQFKLSGGGIRNVALAAAFLAAETRRPVTMADVLHAVRREFQKLGKALRPDELRAASGPQTPVSR